MSKPKKVTIIEPKKIVASTSLSPHISRPLSAYTDTFSDKTGSTSNTAISKKVIKEEEEEEEEEDDDDDDGDGGENVIVSDLPSDTLKWIKKRRDINSSKKIVISFYREKQLREIFDKLNYLKKKALNLNDLTEAIRYVKMRMSTFSEFPHLNNMEETFRNMDDNGDGTIDFEEFSRGMTGTTNSTFDKISEYDLDRFLNFFIEFGEMKQRENAINHINDTIFYEARTANAKKAEVDVVYDEDLTENFFHEEKNDLENYQYFKILFNIKDPKTEKTNLGNSSSNLFPLNSSNNSSSTSSYLSSPRSLTSFTNKPSRPLASSLNLNDKTLFHSENMNNLGKEQTNFQENLLSKYLKVQRKIREMNQNLISPSTLTTLKDLENDDSTHLINEDYDYDEKVFDLKSQIEDEIFFSSGTITPTIENNIDVTSNGLPFSYHLNITKEDPEKVYENFEKRMKNKRLEVYENRLESFGSLVLQKKRDDIRTSHLRKYKESSRPLSVSPIDSANLRGVTIPKSSEPRLVSKDNINYISQTRQRFITRNQAYKEFRAMTASKSVPLLPIIPTLSSISTLSISSFNNSCLSPSSSTSNLQLLNDEHTESNNLIYLPSISSTSSPPSSIPKVSLFDDLFENNSISNFDLSKDSSVKTLPTYLSKVNIVPKKWIRNPSIYAGIKSKKKNHHTISSSSSISSIKSLPQLSR